MREDQSAKNAFLKSLEENFSVGMRRETVDTMEVQKALSRKWKEVKNSQKVASMKAALEDYVAHIQSLSEAFHTIETVTGVVHIPEIVSTIIKSGAQQQCLYHHMSQVTTEMDELEDSLQVARKVAGRLDSIRKDGEAAGANIIKALKDRQTILRKKIEAKTRDCQAAKDAVESVTIPLTVPVTQEMADLFSSPSFREIGSIPTPRTHPEVSASHVMADLADVEAGIVQVIAWNSYIHKPLQSLTVSIPLQQLTAKQFEHSLLSIKSPLEDLQAEEADREEPRTPLREEQFRRRAKHRLTPNRTFDAKRVTKTPTS